MDIQGHRGARGWRPENTLAAFEFAIDLGVTTLELDTGISADGVLVVCHDPFINPALCLDADGHRLPNSPRQLLKNLTLAQIQRFDCGCLNPDIQRFPQQQPVPGSRIPTLQQVFDLAEAKNPGIRYNIESKVSPLRPEETACPEAFAEALVAAIVQNNLTARAMIQSFDWRVLRQVKRLHPQICTVALVHHTPRSSTLELSGASSFLAGFNFVQRAGISALLQATGFVEVYSPNFESLLPDSPSFLQSVSTIQRDGFPVIPWTVNEVRQMQQMIDLAVDGLITDFPDRLLEVLHRP